MSKQGFVQKSKPVLVQAIFGILIGILVVTNTAYTDYKFHDFYVKPTVGQCYSTNQEDYCMKMRELHGLPDDAHIELGNIYWNEVSRQSIFIGAILFLFRISISILNHYFSAGARKIRLVDVYVSFLYGITASLIFLGGFLDLAYYYVQDQPIPSQLPWLNDVGLFNESRTLFGDKNIVDDLDLYATILITFGVIGFLWLWGMLWWSMSKVRRVV